MAKRLLVLSFSLLSLVGRSQTPSFCQEKPFLLYLDSLHALDEKTAYLEFLDRSSPRLKNDTLTLELAHAFFEANQFEKALQSFTTTPLAVRSSSQREYGLCL